MRRRQGNKQQPSMLRRLEHPTAERPKWALIQPEAAAGSARRARLAAARRPWRRPSPAPAGGSRSSSPRARLYYTLGATQHYTARLHATRTRRCRRRRRLGRRRRRAAPRRSEEEGSLRTRGGAAARRRAARPRCRTACGARTPTTTTPRRRRHQMLRVINEFQIRALRTVV